MAFQTGQPGLRWVVWMMLPWILAGCERSEPDGGRELSKGTLAMKTLTVESPAFGANEPVPRTYTGDGQDISPPINWTDLPTGTKELALIMDDPDAPAPKPWVHWVLYRIPPELSGLPEKLPTSSTLEKPAKMYQGKNSWGKSGYGGPAPPRGHGVHHYHFKVYALDLALNLDAGETKEALVDAMAGHVLAEGELIGTYQR